MAAIWDWVRLWVVGTIMADVSFAERCPRSLLQFVNTFTVYAGPQAGEFRLYP